VAVLHLKRDDARRIAVRAQLLDANRPTDLLEVVNHLKFLTSPAPATSPLGADAGLARRQRLLPARHH
jgi:hypothetical protein